MTVTPGSTDSAHQHEFHIQIDRAHFTVAQDQLRGAQLRALPNPPIGSDRDLYEIRPGNPDLLIGDSEAVKMHDGLRFFTAPKQINPGA
jgi:Multiubiquitin